MDSLRDRVDRAVAAATPPAANAGPGIVICAGGCRMFTNAYVLLRVLRETLECTLPVEVWSFGADELSPAMRLLLAELDVEFVDATALSRNAAAQITSGWQLKSLAMRDSRFSEIVYIDADQVPVRDPAAILDWPAYLETGAIFWPDILDLKAENPLWRALGMANQDMPSWETGQVVVDKNRHFKALAAAHCLNENAASVYEMVYGDKDTFLAAWDFCGAERSMVPHRPFIDPRVLVQRDMHGHPLFQHRCNAKWIYGGKQYDHDGSVHYEACLGFLEELAARWNGTYFVPPDRPLRARAEEERLAGAMTRLDVIGDHAVDLEFLPGHEFGSGRAEDRQNWYVTDAEDGLRLVIIDGDRMSYELAQTAPGIWEGRQMAVVSGVVRVVHRQDPLPLREAESRARLGLVGSLIKASGLGRQPTVTPDTPGFAEAAAALSLLLAAEPGIRPEIEHLAAGTTPCSTLAETVLERVSAEKHEPVRDTTIFTNLYQEPPA